MKWKLKLLSVLVFIRAYSFIVFIRAASSHFILFPEETFLRFLSLSSRSFSVGHSLIILAMTESFWANNLEKSSHWWSCIALQITIILIHSITYFENFCLLDFSMHLALCKDLSAFKSSFINYFAYFARVLIILWHQIVQDFGNTSWLLPFHGLNFSFGT